MFPGERKLEPKTPLERVRFNYQLHKVRFLHQLTYNADFQNIHNVIVDPDLRVYAVDNSRACRIQEKLLAPDDLQCFSRGCLERLKALDRTQLEEKPGRWLLDMQIEGLLTRRDRILAIVEERIEEDGEGPVLFP